MDEYLKGIFEKIEQKRAEEQRTAPGPINQDGQKADNLRAKIERDKQFKENLLKQVADNIRKSEAVRREINEACRQGYKPEWIIALMAEAIYLLTGDEAGFNLVKEYLQKLAPDFNPLTLMAKRMIERAGAMIIKIEKVDKEKALKFDEELARAIQSRNFESVKAKCKEIEAHYLALQEKAKPGAVANG
jgi:hypothetical protein